MNLPSIPLMVIAGILIIYLVWRLMGPAKKKNEQQRFSIRKHRRIKTDDEEG